MEYQKEFAAEQQYLDRTLGFIRENLAREEAACSDEKEQIVSARKEMWENVSFRGGFDNAVEAHQVLESIQAQSGRYDAAHKRIDHYRSRWNLLTLPASTLPRAARNLPAGKDLHRPVHRPGRGQL